MRSCSTIRCPSVAMPEVPTRSEPGFAFASLTTSAKLCPAKAGVARRYTGEYITLASGAMSFSAS